MLTYKAMYKYLDEGVHAEVLDFPGVITCGKDLAEARHLLSGALVDMAETNLLEGEPLPQPDPDRTDPDADLEEPIHLLLRAASRLLADDLMMGQGGSELRAGAEYPVWSPYNATKAPTALLEALREDSESAHE